MNELTDTILLIVRSSNQTGFGLVPQDVMIPIEKLAMQTGMSTFLLAAEQAQQQLNTQQTAAIPEHESQALDEYSAYLHEIIQRFRQQLQANQNMSSVE